jgi:hypothetical protein
VQRAERADNSCRLRPGWCSWAGREEEVLDAVPPVAFRSSCCRFGRQARRAAAVCERVQVPVPSGCVAAARAPRPFCIGGITQPRAASVHEREGRRANAAFLAACPNGSMYPSVQPPFHVGTCYIPRTIEKKPSQDRLPVLIVLTPPSPSLAACEANWYLRCLSKSPVLTLLAIAFFDSIPGRTYQPIAADPVAAVSS